MKLNLVGIPSFAGALYSGTEVAAAHLREAGLVAALAQRGIQAQDLGDLILPTYLPRHNVPPVRNWPAPRMVWDAILRDAADWFADDAFTLMLGGDCSIVTGTASYLHQRFGDDLYLLVVDAHVDAVQPSPARCLGAAASGLWLLACDNEFWPRPALNPAQITVVGCQSVPAETYGMQTVPCAQVREQGVAVAVRTLLAQLPAGAKILVHFDVDAIGQADMPAAYSPSEVGFSAAECEALLTPVLADPRVVGMEVTEFSGLRDVDGSAAKRLVQLLADALGRARPEQRRDR